MPDMSLEQRQHALCAAIAPLAVASHLLGLGLGYLPGIAIALSLLPLLRPALTIPNAVTVARLAIPCLHAISPLASPAARLSAGLAFVALDFVDGALARWLRQTSRSGAVLDEEADSFGTLVASAEMVRRGLVPLWLAAHQGLAHYLFLLLRLRLCPHFSFHFPLARSVAGAGGAPKRVSTRVWCADAL
ncbi:hypothetical protein EMIHUDRAFT_252203 [Emiliania huxleyi CCMP1516]|uniref:CDP-alcohol phosphatidyltransferase n=2 Tax=Emiliania huxleyi TaxID=2903 RepID=A0A0D3KMX0_EMIH1|nr:hypothetical protein EMIHUDRAFT_252203 [Emiliania huxleyi CCMP1516]EOD37105.1 hypothetical protein EMIHUDRAFT_252203 [Emiliania huxleyi CCMP1516]|eukprot:XP_005789534.1 hypothetical protein EMIHUDRAFT_252203 [Emiliania huxleyi CCMP1516]